MVTDLSVKHNYADLGDVMLHYVTAGMGPPVVLCMVGHKPGGNGDM